MNTRHPQQSTMHDFLDAIVHLCDTMLLPFTGNASSFKIWHIVVGALFAMLGIAALATLSFLALTAAG